MTEVILAAFEVAKPRRLSQIIQGIKDVSGRFVNIRCVITVLHVAECAHRFVFHHIGKANDGAERSAQFMRQGPHQIKIYGGCIAIFAAVYIVTIVCIRSHSLSVIAQGLTLCG